MFSFFLAYDHRDRLVAVADRDSPAGPVTKAATYTYDAFDRRVAKALDPDGTGPATPARTFTAHDGVEVLADLDATGTVTRRYLHGPAVDQVLARLDATGAVDWYLADRLGSVRALARIGTAAATVLDRIDYDAFGNTVAETVPAAGDRFQFTGRELDPETGLYYYRARYYDPATGRFLAQDPLGFAAGDPNLYRYVGNSPTNATDPSGLQAQPATGGGGTGGGGGTPVRTQPTPINGIADNRVIDAPARRASGLQAAVTIRLEDYRPRVDDGLKFVLVPDDPQAVEAEVRYWERKAAWIEFQECWEARLEADLMAMAEYSRNHSSNVETAADHLAVGAPGFAERLIPLWGSGRTAINDFQNNRWGWGSFNTVLAVSDVFLIKSLITAGGKFLIQGGAKTLSRQAAEDIATKTAAARITQRASPGVIVRQTGNYVIKEVDQNAGRLAQLYGRTGIQAQAEALARLGNMAPNSLYKNGKLIMAYAGKYDGGLLKTWLRGSLRLGTIFNDISPRNIGAMGKIFDPVLAPMGEFALKAIVYGLYEEATSSFKTEH